jgi:hypothetical protein
MPIPTIAPVDSPPWSAVAAAGVPDAASFESVDVELPEALVDAAALGAVDVEPPGALADVDAVSGDVVPVSRSDAW